MNLLLFDVHSRLGEFKSHSRDKVIFYVCMRICVCVQEYVCICMHVVLMNMFICSVFSLCCVLL